MHNLNKHNEHRQGGVLVENKCLAASTILILIVFHKSLEENK